MNRLLLRAVRLPDGIRDVAIDDGLIAGIGERLAFPGAEVVDGAGGQLIPGLHDHHLHLYALAATRTSVPCGPPDVRTPDHLAAALATAPGSPTGWIRGVGYVETVAGLLDTTALDRLHAHRPVRLQHRSGAVWFLNSRAAEAVGLASGDHPGIERDATGRPTGRLWRADGWLRARIGDAAAPDLREVGAQLAAHGVTGITDATPDLAPETVSALVSAHLDGAVPQRIHLLGVPLHAPAPTVPTVTVGPEKIVLADSDLPDYPSLLARVRSAHEAGRGVAVHCVTREALLLLLAALDEAGGHPGDRIEHGALIPVDTIAELRRRAITVVTQPGFLTDRGDDFADRLDARDLPDLYRCRSLLDHDVPTALSSDAPYGPVDPWAVIDAAATRAAPDGRVVGDDERIGRRRALDRYSAPLSAPGAAARTVAVGEPADLVLLDGDLDEALTAGSDAVRCTIIRGRVVHHR